MYLAQVCAGLRPVSVGITAVDGERHRVGHRITAEQRVVDRDHRDTGAGDERRGYSGGADGRRVGQRTRRGGQRRGIPVDHGGVDQTGGEIGAVDGEREGRAAGRGLSRPDGGDVRSGARLSTGDSEDAAEPQGLRGLADRATSR